MTNELLPVQIRIWAQQILSEKMNEPKTKYKKKSSILSQKQVYMLHKIDTWFSIIDLIHQKIDLYVEHTYTHIIRHIIYYNKKLYETTYIGINRCENFFGRSRIAIVMKRFCFCMTSQSFRPSLIAQDGQCNPLST